MSNARMGKRNSEESVEQERNNLMAKFINVDTKKDDNRVKLFELAKVPSKDSPECVREGVSDHSKIETNPPSTANHGAKSEVDTITDLHSTMSGVEEAGPPKVKGVDTKAVASLNRCGYELLEELGSGGFSKVYKVKSKHPPYQEYACKMFDLTKIEENWNMKCLRQEMLIMFKIVHPNIVHGMDTFKTRTSAFIIMKFAKNGTVASYLSKLSHCGLTETQARVWWSDILSALQYLHEKRIAHRDIKCENFLIDDYFNALLSDFSFSIEADSAKGGSPKVHNREAYRRTICGTPCYMAPELHALKESQVYDPFPVDIFAMGVALFEMLNNDVPYDGDYGCETMIGKMVAKRYVYKEWAAGCREAVRQLIDRLLEPDPKRRPSAKEVAAHEWVTNKDNP